MLLVTECRIVNFVSIWYIIQAVPFYQEIK